MFKALRELFSSKPKMQRVDLKYVDYAEADKLIREQGYTVAPEEDNNKVIGMVYIEKLQPVEQPKQCCHHHHGH